MNLTIANVAGAVPQADLQAAVAAINTQVAEHFGPEWGVAAVLTAAELALGGNQVALSTSPDAIIYLGSASQDPTTGVPLVYGYHSTNYGHIPYGFVYRDVCAQYGEDWSVTLSHEVLELLADPSATRTVTGAAPASSAAAGRNVAYDVEVCDPTQGDTYVIGAVTVSNFVTKRYFGLSGPSAATNQLGLALDPFGVRPGGYFQYEDGGTTGEINGPAVPASRIEARKILGPYRRNGRRRKRLAAQVVKAADIPSSGGQAIVANRTARQQQSAAHDRTSQTLAYSVTSAFFLLLFLLIIIGFLCGEFGVTIDSDIKNLLFTLFGVIATGWANIVGYYFGSSAGSAQKTQAMSDALANQNPPAQGAPAS